MARGPLPSPGARRRNAPTIPGTDLPVEGRKGRIPVCPYDLAAAGAAWWRWAWRTPQSTRWDAGSLYLVARRAQLEDDVAALGFGEDLVELSDLLAGVADVEAVQRVEWALTVLKRNASGSLAIRKEMRELDNRLGLNPKAMADLRWKVAAVAEAEAGRVVAPVTTLRIAK